MSGAGSLRNGENMSKNNYAILANVIAAHAVAVQRWTCALESIKRIHALVNSANSDALRRTVEIAGEAYNDATDRAMSADAAARDLMEEPALVGVDYLRQVAHAIDLDAQIIVACEEQAQRIATGAAVFA